MGYVHLYKYLQYIDVNYCYDVFLFYILVNSLNYFFFNTLVPARIQL